MSRLAACALLLAPAFALSPAGAEDAPDIVVTADKPRASIDNPPSSRAGIDAARIDTTINALTVADTIKYLPSLVVRQRHVGDTQAPLATRTSGVGASARSLIYADGALLSALIGNNNTTASPRWGLVTPQEVARVDVLYGPFSAAYPGNSIGAVVNIATRMPDAFEATVDATSSVQQFRQFGTDRTPVARQFGATIGDRFGPLSVFASVSRTVSDSQPLSYVTAAATTVSGAARPVSGGFAGVARTGLPVLFLGAGGFEHQRQDTLKVKAALDLTPSVRLTYVGGLFVNDTDATAETYLTDAAGLPAYAGTLAIGGKTYSVPASAFSNTVYSYDERHWSHSLSATGTSGPVEWQVIGTLYDFARDVQRMPATALPAAASGGSGTITRLDGTGWTTIDAKGLWHAGAHAIGFGVHRDRFELKNDRFATTDWIRGADGPLTLAARGKTRTQAVWVQDAWTLAPPLTLTLGARYERWRAFDGFNFSAAPALAVTQPRLSSTKFSPKAALAWVPATSWSVTASFGQAYRFPTVSELYQAVTTGSVIAVPNPTLRPERARSEELAIRHGDDARFVRLSLFNEVVDDALLSQAAPLVPGSSTLFSYVQNVDRLRTRGVELAVQQGDIVPDIDVSGSVTLVDPRITADAAFPAAVGKRPPQVPLRRATAVVTWRPDSHWALTAAARYSSRAFGTIDNSDPVANTWQGFAGYVVADPQAPVEIGRSLNLAIGVDNVSNARHFLSHPFPQRTIVADLGARVGIG